MLTMSGRLPSAGKMSASTEIIIKSSDMEGVNVGARVDSNIKSLKKDKECIKRLVLKAILIMLAL